MKKKLVSLFLATVMMLSLLPISALASVTTYGITNGSPMAEKDKNGGYITVDESAAYGDKVEVTVVPNSGYRIKHLMYTSAPKTVADILPTEFPIAESELSEAPGSAWKSATLDQFCYISYDKSKLLFYKDSGNPDKSFSINTDEIVSLDEDGNYVYTDEDGTTVTFSMTGEGGALNSIVFANTANETWNGTYQESACVAAGTMITMYNGEQKKVEDIEIGDVIRTFDHENGEVSSAPVCFIWESKNAANAFTLTFDGGIEVTVIEEHGFYDSEKSQYVFINAKNAKDYIGHHFYNADTNSWYALKSIELLHKSIDAYAIATSKHLNHLSNGMLSVCDGTFEKIANLFAFDGQMKYNEELKKKDIEDYGLTPLKKVLKYKGFNRADYYDYNLQYLDIAIGKGLITTEWVEALSDYCAANDIYDSLPESEMLKGVEVLKMLMSVSAPKIMLAGAPEPTAEDSIEITANEQGKYIFDMPAQNIIVTAEFEKIHTHSLEEVQGKTSTETESGWKNYYECKGREDACHKYFEDAAGEVEITDIEKWKAEGGNGYLPRIEIQEEPIYPTKPTDKKDPTDQTNKTDSKNTRKPINPTNSADTTSPKTGDASNIIIWMLLALSSMGLCAFLVLGKKRKNEQ